MQPQPLPRGLGPPRLARHSRRNQVPWLALLTLCVGCSSPPPEPIAPERAKAQLEALQPYLGQATASADTRGVLWLPPDMRLELPGPVTLELASGGPCPVALKSGGQSFTGGAEEGWKRIVLPDGPLRLTAESPCGAGAALWTVGIPLEQSRLVPAAGAAELEPLQKPSTPQEQPGALVRLWRSVVRALGAPLAPAAEVPSQPDRPSLVLITIDTLRPDPLSPYGGPPTLTPVMARLAQESQVFEQARAHAPWTGPSVAALLTGRPSAGLDRQAELAPTLGTLPEALKRAGYRTLAVVNNPRLTAGTGFERGFDRHLYLDSDQTVVTELPALLDSLKRPDKAPIFAWIHLLGPHRPLEPAPEDLAAAGWDPSLGEPILEDAETIGPEAHLGEQEQKRIKRLYQAEVHQADRHLGQLLAILGQRLPGATLAVTSDHGEELFEHQSYGHGHALYHQLLHVPLLLKGERFVPGSREAQLVRLCELAPTFLTLANQAIPATMQCQPIWERTQQPLSMAGNLIHGPRLVSVEGKNWKLVREETGPVHALWKATSPEVDNLASSQPQVVEAFTREADAFVSGSRALQGPLRAVLTLSGQASGTVEAVLRSDQPLSLLPLASPGRFGRVEIREGGKVWRITGTLQPPDSLGVRFEVKLAAQSEVLAEVSITDQPVSLDHWRVAGAPAQQAPYRITPDSEGWRGEVAEDGSLRVDLWLEPREDPPAERIFTEEEREKLRALGYAN